MNGRKLELITTADGSPSLFVPELDETYHSRHGAIRESLHVFIEHGLATINQSHIRILEVGFGTGLNALLALEYAVAKGISLHYTALETYPLPVEATEHLELPEAHSREFYRQLHSAPWESDWESGMGFTLHKRQLALQDFREEQALFDCIFFDAFGPRAQPDMWKAEIFQNLFRMTVPGGVWVSYCSRGQVRRDLIAAGWVVEKLPGPPGKREMMRGTRS